MKTVTIFAAVLTAAASTAVAQAEPTFYADRAEFNAAVGKSITDGYTAYAQGVYPDAEMSAVLGETRYVAVSNPNSNSVGDVFLRGDGSNYCAGCNGNFRLVFDVTSVSTNGSVFGVALDFVLHTSRYVSIGDDNPINPTYPGIVLIHFADGSTQQTSIPADIGYYEANSFFLGISDERGITSVTVGTESRPHFWVIDNLTVAASPDQPPGELLQQLLVDVIGIGPGKSLANKVKHALAYYAVPDIQATCAMLTAFGHEVRAQRGKKIEVGLADKLTADAGAIMTAIACN